MTRHEEIQNAYKALGKEATFYDGMMTYSKSGIPDDFAGKLLEVPVGTGVQRNYYGSVMKRSSAALYQEICDQIRPEERPPLHAAEHVQY